MPGKKILVIDDDAAIRLLCKTILKMAEYEVETKENVAEGLAELEKNKYDLLLLDIQLPDKYGTEALPEIKEKYPEMSVIMVSGYGNMEIVMGCFLMGAFDYVAKPFSKDYLVRSIKRCLERKGPIEEIEEFKDLNYLYEISKAMKEKMPLDKLIKMIISAGLSTLKADSGSVMLLDEKTQELVIKETLGLKKEKFKSSRIKIGSGISGWVIKVKQPLLFTDNYDDDPEFSKNEKRSEIKSAIIVPLIHEDKALGVLNINNIVSERVFNDQDLKLMTLFARDCSKALVNSLP